MEKSLPTCSPTWKGAQKLFNLHPTKALVWVYSSWPLIIPRYIYIYMLKMLLYHFVMIAAISVIMPIANQRREERERKTNFSVCMNWGRKKKERTERRRRERKEGKWGGEFIDFLSTHHSFYIFPSVIFLSCDIWLWNIDSTLSVVSLWIKTKSQETGEDASSLIASNHNMQTVHNKFDSGIWM